MKKIELSKETIEWIAFGVLGTIGLILIVSIFFVRPTLKQKKALLKEYLKRSEQLRTDERIAGKQKALIKSVENYTQDLKKLQKSLPDPSGPFSILAILNEKAQETGTIFTRIEPKTPPSTESARVTGFEMKDYLIQFNSGYHRLGAFLNRLENTSPFIRIEDVRIRANPNMPGEHEVKVVIRCVVDNP